MPNLEEFVIGRGTEFTNSFVTSTLCCPSRATFLTGQYSHNHGVLTNEDILEFDDTNTIVTWLSNAGYRTGLVGKYLNGYGTTVDAEYIPPGWDSWQALVEPNHKRVYNYTISNNGILEKYGERPSDYQTDVFATLASDFINNSDIVGDEIPFFLLITTFAPHIESVYVSEPCSFYGDKILTKIRGPLRYEGTANDIQLPKSPSFNEIDLSDKPYWIRNLPPFYEGELTCLDGTFRGGIESMRAVDDLIGVVIQALFDNEEFENTVIIFTSDNGYGFGAHRVVKKEYPYEEIIRVPLFISSPDYTNLQSSSRLVINNDLAPTILELANVTADISIDGASLVPLLSDPNEENWRERFLVEFTGKCTKTESGIFQCSRPPPTFNVIRTSSQVLIQYMDPKAKAEFYDLEIDPYQLNNKIDCTSTTCIEQIDVLKIATQKLRECKEETCHFWEAVEIKLEK